MGFDFPEDISQYQLARDYTTTYKFLNEVEQIATRYLDHDIRKFNLVNPPEDLEKSLLELLKDYGPDLWPDAYDYLAPHPHNDILQG